MLLKLQRNTDHVYNCFTLFDFHFETNYIFYFLDHREPDRTMGADLDSDSITTSLSNNLSGTTHVLQIARSATSTQYPYGKPEIIVQPKQEWNVRYLKDLIQKVKKERKKKKNNGKHQKKRTQLNKEKKRKFIGLLQGVGPQRSRIQVKVSCSFASITIEIVKFLVVLRFPLKRHERCILVVRLELLQIKIIVQK
jgi:hypothetical protein